MSWEDALKSKNDASEKRLRRIKQQVRSAKRRGDNYLPNSKWANKSKKLEYMIKSSGRISEVVYYLLKRDEEMRQLFLDEHLNGDEDMLKEYMESMAEWIQLKKKIEQMERKK